MVSSANVLILAFTIQLGMSLIYIKKSGPRVELCGTSQWIGSGFDLTLSTSTYCVRSL